MNERDPAKRLLRLRARALMDARAEAGRRLAELAVAEDLAARLAAIAPSYYPARAADGSAFVALAAAKDRLARARAATETRRVVAARQSADAATATAVARAAHDAAAAARARASAATAAEAERRRLEALPGLARRLQHTSDTP